MLSTLQRELCTERTRQSLNADRATGRTVRSKRRSPIGAQPSTRAQKPVSTIQAQCRANSAKRRSTSHRTGNRSQAKVRMVANKAACEAAPAVDEHLYRRVRPPKLLP